MPLKMNMPADPFSPYCSVLGTDTVLLQVNRILWNDHCLCGSMFVDVVSQPYPWINLHSHELVTKIPIDINYITNPNSYTSFYVSTTSKILMIHKH